MIYSILVITSSFVMNLPIQQNKIFGKIKKKIKQTGRNKTTDIPRPLILFLCNLHCQGFEGRLAALLRLQTNLAFS